MTGSLIYFQNLLTCCTSLFCIQSSPAVTSISDKFWLVRLSVVPSSVAPSGETLLFEHIFKLWLLWIRVSSCQKYWGFYKGEEEVFRWFRNAFIQGDNSEMRWGGAGMTNRPFSTQPPSLSLSLFTVWGLLCVQSIGTCSYIILKHIIISKKQNSLGRFYRLWKYDFLLWGDQNNCF